MPFPVAHNYLTVHFQASGSVEEEGQFGLRFTGAFPAAGAEVTTAADVQTWWTNGSGGMPSTYNLKNIKIARILPSGDYDPAITPLVFNYSPAPAGGDSTAIIFPLQVAFCVRLKTGLLNGPAHFGRVYLPALAATLSGNRTWPSPDATGAVNAFGACLSALSGGPLGTLVVMSKGTPAAPGGISHPVTAIDADTRPDIQRRRARQQVSARTVEVVIS